MVRIPLISQLISERKNIFVTYATIDASRDYKVEEEIISPNTPIFLAYK